jgi:hypothetical protein
MESWISDLSMALSRLTLVLCACAVLGLCARYVLPPVPSSPLAAGSVGARESRYHYPHTLFGLYLMFHWVGPGIGHAIVWFVPHDCLVGPWVGPGIGRAIVWFVPYVSLPAG